MWEGARTLDPLLGGVGEGAEEGEERVPTVNGLHLRQLLQQPVGHPQEGTRPSLSEAWLLNAVAHTFFWGGGQDRIRPLPLGQSQHDKTRGSPPPSRGCRYGSE